MGKPRPASQKKSTGGKPLRAGKEAGKVPGTVGQGSSDDRKSSRTSAKGGLKKGTSGATAKPRITKKKHERARHAGAHGLLPKLEAEGTKKSSLSPAQVHPLLSSHFRGRRLTFAQGVIDIVDACIRTNRWARFRMSSGRACVSALPFFGSLVVAKLLRAVAQLTRVAGGSNSFAKRRKRAANSTALGVVSGIRSSLEELLEETEKRSQPSRTDGSTGTNASKTKSSLNNKRRVKLVAEETRHLKEVIEHPAFVANPMAALREHLKNTVAPKPPRERW
eukprot:6179019-Pleurochrysis_carterae.AAC.1